MDRVKEGLWSSWWRVAGLAGIVLGAVLMATSAWFLAAAPRFDDPARAVRVFFADSIALYLTFDLVVVLFAVFLLPLFASGLRGFLIRAEGGYGMWSRLVFAGAILCAACALVAGIFWRGMALGGVNQLSDPVLAMVMQLDAAAYTMVWLALGLMTLSGSMVMIRTRVLPPWLGWLGVLATLLVVVGTAWTFTASSTSVLAYLGPGGALLSMLWVVLVGAVLVSTRVLPAHMPGEGLFSHPEMRIEPNV